MENCTQSRIDALPEEEERRIKRNRIDTLNQPALLEMEDRLKKVKSLSSITVPTGDSNPCEIGYLCY